MLHDSQTPFFKILNNKINKNNKLYIYSTFQSYKVLYKVET